MKISLLQMVLIEDGNSKKSLSFINALMFGKETKRCGLIIPIDFAQNPSKKSSRLLFSGNFFNWSLKYISNAFLF
ncbi:hypothetical protein P872_10185 [Rhodonellum psychrophilum GCM71 = DSM 17998]|uniref:Uncharacterized protein n=1 Tax=Rhodonellum psychrophilum GCM71 = DSM 17998 TaxID=1123057 RepID=U5BVA4_9BACT|nr:hypothetical protein P872_10185 [Rhodonellum psychrophilum GCM71 = DSM 17998]